MPRHIVHAEAHQGQEKGDTGVEGVGCQGEGLACGEPRGQMVDNNSQGGGACIYASPPPDGFGQGDCGGIEYGGDAPDDPAPVPVEGDEAVRQVNDGDNRPVDGGQGAACSSPEKIRELRLFPFRNITQGSQILNIIPLCCFFQDSSLYKISENIKQMTICYPQKFRCFCMLLSVQSIAGSQ